MALPSALALASCKVAHASGLAQAPGIDVLSAGRIGAVVAGLVGLTGVIIAAQTLARSGRLGSSNAQRRAISALVAGLLGMALGGLVLTTAAGGVGTGNGVGGAIVAMVVGLVSVLLGGLTLARFRRTV